MGVKPLVCVGNAREALRGFPPDARAVAGFQLYRVQQGLEPADWKPMPVLGQGVAELRVRTGRAFRVIYIARFIEAVYVLHAFEKKSRKTTARDLAIAKQRLTALRHEREGK